MFSLFYKTCSYYVACGGGPRLVPQSPQPRVRKVGSHVVAFLRNLTALRSGSGVCVLVLRYEDTACCVHAIATGIDWRVICLCVWHCYSVCCSVCCRV